MFDHFIGMTDWFWQWPNSKKLALTIFKANSVLGMAATYVFMLP